MRFLKTFCTAALVSTCLSTASNAAAMVSTDFETAKQHTRQHFLNNPVDSFNGHIPLTGNDTRDAALIGNPGTINSKRSLELHREFTDLLRHKTLTELFNLGKIDFTDATLRTREEEKGLADLTETAARLSAIIQEGIAIGDPFFTDIDCVQTESFEKVLERAKKGSTVAAKRVARTDTFLDPFTGKSYLTLQTENPDHLSTLEKLSENGSVYFQYHYLYLIHLEQSLSPEQKMSIFKGMENSAGTDFWGIYRYVDLLKKNIDSEYTSEMATVDWLDLFQKTAALPIGQDIVMRQIRNEDGTLIAPGYMDALYLFAETARSEPLHVALRKIAEKTKTFAEAECYIHKFLYKLPDTIALEHAAKLTAVESIAEIVPEIKGLLAQIIVSTDPEKSLGYSAKTPSERLAALTALATTGLGSSKAQELLAKANIGGMSHHLFDDLRIHLGLKDSTETAMLNPAGTPEENLGILEQRRVITQTRIADILYLALNNPRNILNLLLTAPDMDEVAIAAAQFAVMMQSSADGIPDALTTLPSIKPQSILRFNLELNKTLGILHVDADLDALETAAMHLFAKHSSTMQILTDANDLTGGYINFYRELGAFVNIAERLIAARA